MLKCMSNELCVVFLHHMYTSLYYLRLVASVCQAMQVSSQPTLYPLAFSITLNVIVVTV